MTARALTGARARADGQAGMVRAAGERWVGAQARQGAAEARQGATEARQGATGARQGAAGARGARGLGARGPRPGRAGLATWARGLAAGCALGALGLFLIRFDSVFFLSQFLDIVREPGS